MYQDPKRVRSHKCTVYLDEYEAAIIQAHANYSGVSRAEMMRQLMLQQAREAFGIDPASLSSNVPVSAG